MKTLVRCITLLVVFSMVAACNGTPATTEPVQPPADDAQPTEQTLSEAELWAQANEVGPWQTTTQDWAAIEAAAIAEGSVIIYANSSKIAKAVEAWQELYPQIKIEGYDLGGDDVLAKTLGEQQSGLIVGDVWFSSGGAELVGTVLPKNYVWRFVPDTMSGLPDELTHPLLMSRFGTTVLAYNSELNEACPISNIWELTQPEWQGKIVVEDPLNDASTLSKLVTFIYHTEEMHAAYVDLYGSEPVLDADTPNAGWLWFKRLAQNNPIPQPGGDEVDAAFATPGMDQSLLAFTSYSNYADVEEGNLVFEPCWGLEPVVGVQSQSYLGIMNQAPHPNAAKLFIRFITSEIGRDPWAKFGTYFADPSYEVPEGQLTLDEIQQVTWFIAEQFAYENMVQARDFYLINLGSR